MPDRPEPSARSPRRRPTAAASEARPGTEATAPAPTVRLGDVARLAGVSPATATRALHGFPRMRPETRTRVQEAARTLGYVPDLGARALATRSSRTIGLLMPATSDSFWGEVAAGLEERAIAEGFSLLLATSHGEAERERAMVELFVGKRVDGIVIGSAAGVPSTWFPRGRPPIPLVLVDWNAPCSGSAVEAARSGPIATGIRRIHRISETDFPHVYTDDVEGAERAVRHLLGLGHREIAFVGVAPSRTSLLRLLGLRRALARHDLEPVVAIECDLSLEGGRRAGLSLLESARRPTAVLAFDDMVAVGVMRALALGGLRVPHDMSVVGFDDVEVAAFVDPPLTTVRQPKQALGDLAMEVILGKLRDVEPGLSTRLLGSLVARQSTGPAPGAIPLA